MTDRSDELERRAQIESDRIKKELCPKCGRPIKDKGSYIRCTSCPWSLNNGEYNSEEGYCIEYVDYTREPELPEAIAQHTTIEKRQSDYIGKCPFHDDAANLLTVKRDDQGWFFSCFACGKKGRTIADFLKLLGKYGKLQ